MLCKVVEWQRVQSKFWLVVTGQAGFGDFRSGLEFLFEDFVLRMIGSDPKLFFFGGLLCHFPSRRNVFFGLGSHRRSRHYDPGTEKQDPKAQANRPDDM